MKCAVVRGCTRSVHVLFFSISRPTCLFRLSKSHFFDACHNRLHASIHSNSYAGLWPHIHTSLVYISMPAPCPCLARPCPRPCRRPPSWRLSHGSWSGGSPACIDVFFDSLHCLASASFVSERSTLLLGRCCWMHAWPRGHQHGWSCLFVCGDFVALWRSSRALYAKW